MVAMVMRYSDQPIEGTYFSRRVPWKSDSDDACVSVAVLIGVDVMGDCDGMQ